MKNELASYRAMGHQDDGGGCSGGGECRYRSAIDVLLTRLEELEAEVERLRGVVEIGGAAISSMIPHLAHDGLCERCQRTKDAWYEALDFPADLIEENEA